MMGLYNNRDEFGEFFVGYGNITNSVLVLLYSFILITFVIYYHVKIHLNQHRFSKKPEVKEQFENFLEGLHGKNIYSSQYNIIYLYRRFSTALCLCLVTQYPSIQIQSVMIMSLMTIGYISFFLPFIERQQNINAIINEICVVLCAYVIMIFMMSNNVKLSDVMTIVFMTIVALNVIFFAV